MLSPFSVFVLISPKLLRLTDPGESIIGTLSTPTESSESGDSWMAKLERLSEARIMTKVHEIGGIAPMYDNWVRIVITPILATPDQLGHQMSHNRSILELITTGTNSDVEAG